MIERPRVLLSSMRAAVALATSLALFLGTVAPAGAAGTATFEGTVVGPDNALAQGFTVVFKETTGGQTFKSLATGPNGAYTATVQVGGVYKLDSVIAPDGKKLPVQNMAPIAVQAAGPNRLDVKFTNAVPPATTSTANAQTAPSQHQAKAGPPWWKSGGAITGIVLGSVLLVGAGVAFAGGNSTDTPIASPSNPEQP